MCLVWNKEVRATGRAIVDWYRGATRTACLADLRRAVRNIVDRTVQWEV